MEGSVLASVCTEHVTEHHGGCFKVYGSVVFRTSTLYHHRHYLAQNFLITPKEIPTLSAISPQPLLLQRPASTNYFLSPGMCLLGHFAEWKHVLCGLLRLAPFAQHNVRKVRLCCRAWRCIIPFHG